MNTFKTATSRFKNWIAHLFNGMVIVILFHAELFAQPPGLPGNPDQAPIDGGLSILAALGGGYAIKKLRDRNRE